MAEKLPIDGHINLVRDPVSGAVLNINKSSIRQAREAKALRKQKEEEMSRINGEIYALKNEMAEIKSLLLQMVKKNG